MAKTGDTSQSLAAGRQYTSRPVGASCGKGAKRMLRSKLIALTLAVGLIAGCRSDRPMSAPVPVASAPESSVEGTVVGDDRTSMEAAIDTYGVASPSATPLPSEAPGAVVMNPNAPDSYVVKRG